jgi:hypothetical protein
MASLEISREAGVAHVWLARFAQSYSSGTPNRLLKK